MMVTQSAHAPIRANCLHLHISRDARGARLLHGFVVHSCRVIDSDHDRGKSARFIQWEWNGNAGETREREFSRMNVQLTGTSNPVIDDAKMHRNFYHGNGDLFGLAVRNKFVKISILYRHRV